MAVILEPKSLARIGVVLLDSDPIELRCKKCGTQWQPGLLASGRLPKGWWKCPTDPKHTIDWDTYRSEEPASRQADGTQKLKPKRFS